MQHGPAIREIKVGKVRDGSGQIGVLPYWCDPRRPPPPCRSEIRR